MNDEKRKVRFAVVGLGHIAQVAVLPAFLNGEQPRPSGYEGLADISVIEAIKRSALCGKSQKVNSKKVAGGTSKPNIDLVNVKPAVQKPQLVNVESGSK